MKLSERMLWPVIIKVQENICQENVKKREREREILGSVIVQVDIK